MSSSNNILKKKTTSSVGHKTRYNKHFPARATSSAERNSRKTILFRKTTLSLEFKSNVGYGVLVFFLDVANVSTS